jgi:hypothetical protein
MIREWEHWETITSSQIVRKFRQGISVGVDEKEEVGKWPVQAQHLFLIPS